MAKRKQSPQQMVVGCLALLVLIIGVCALSWSLVMRTDAARAANIVTDAQQWCVQTYPAPSPALDRCLDHSQQLLRNPNEAHIMRCGEQYDAIADVANCLGFE
jgi:hypothetical protein